MIVHADRQCRQRDDAQHRRGLARRPNPARSSRSDTPAHAGRDQDREDDRAVTVERRTAIDTKRTPSQGPRGSASRGRRSAQPAGTRSPPPGPGRRRAPGPAKRPRRRVSPTSSSRLQHGRRSIVRAGPPCRKGCGSRGCCARRAFIPTRGQARSTSPACPIPRWPTKRRSTSVALTRTAACAAPRMAGRLKEHR
jgi:hypothetical protein